uniref:Uncharacterized protein n=1 Tax=Picea sitchensis TaxID=3332 RepID=A0A6B9XS66_PICSI|nr:hypothetical protein Q903MT_gene3835 [Picea sitchensis]
MSEQGLRQGNLLNHGWLPQTQEVYGSSPSHIALCTLYYVLVVAYSVPMTTRLGKKECFRSYQLF